MSDQEISKVLIKRIFYNIGLGTQKGVFDSRNILNKKLKIQEVDDSVSEYIIYSADCFYLDSVLTAIVSNIGTEDKPDYVLFFSSPDILFSLRYSLNPNDSGLFLTRWESKWVDMNVLQKLNLTAATELIADNGYIWTPVSDVEKSFEILQNYLSEE